MEVYTGDFLSPSREMNKQYPDIIIIEPRTLNDEGCQKIIDIHSQIEEVEFEFGEGDHEIIPEDDTVSFRYHHTGKEMATIRSPEADEVLRIVGDLLPNHPDFEQVHYMQIVKYNERSWFPFHEDASDMSDTGTTMILLNDDYSGGELMIEPGVRITPSKGTIISFNNSTGILHGVEPIYSGCRYVLLIWYGRNTNDTEVQ